jgi:osmotically-inducible protein OsmY
MDMTDRWDREYDRDARLWREALTPGQARDFGPNPPRAEEILERRIRAEWASDPDLAGCDLQAQAGPRGQVVLRGAVPDARLRARAERRALAVAGVRGVTNELRLAVAPR